MYRQWQKGEPFSLTCICCMKSSEYMSSCLLEIAVLLLNTRSANSTVHLSNSHWHSGLAFLIFLTPGDLLWNVDALQMARHHMSVIHLNPLRKLCTLFCAAPRLSCSSPKHYDGLELHIWAYDWGTSIGNVIPGKPPQSFRGRNVSCTMELFDFNVPLTTWIASYFYSNLINNLANVVEELLQTFYLWYTQFHLWMTPKRFG